MEKDMQVIYSEGAIEFATVAVQFCNFMEGTEGMKRPVFVDTALKLLPLLYLKASMLPETGEAEGDMLESFVTEDTYEDVRSSVASIMGNKDVYLEVFMQDMKYSDTPINANISEDLADIYQDIRNFVGIYELQYEETMQDALAVCRENFGHYWGQKLVNTLRALHDVKYSLKDDEEEGDWDEGLNEDEL